MALDTAGIASRFARPIASQDALFSIVGPPGDLAVRKERRTLDHHMRAFIADSPFLTMATYGADGRCDVSPRGDAPGFVMVRDDRTLVIPERPGNKRTDSMKNVLQTGRIGLLFMIPGYGETLRVNGTACIVQDEGVLAAMSVQGRTPVLGIAVDVEECFLHCARAIHRSRLWGDRQDTRRSSTTCAAEILIEHAGMTAELPVETFDDILQNAYKHELY